MNNNIQCSIESSTTKIELNSAVDGVFLVPELEGLVGLPEIRTTSGVNAGYDGGWTSAQNYDARLISIRGVIANPDISKVEDKRRAIASLLGQGRKEQLTLRFTTEAGNAYAISVRTISCEMALQRVLTTQEFLIQLRADDPLIYDDGTTGGIAAILQPQRALGGFEINFGLPLAIGGGAEDTVVDNGNETAYPVIKMYGALHSPTVVNRTTNQQMQILADLQYSIDWHTYRSATGDYILVSDGLNGAPMTLSQLLGNAEQTTYSGKNLFNINATPTLGHTTVSVSGQSITVTSDAQAITARAEIPFTYEADRQMTISFDATCLTYEPTATNTSIVYLRSGSNSAGYKSIGHTVGATTHYTTTFTPTVAGMNLWLYLKSSNVAGVVSFRFDNIQVEYGASETDYEPFVGGTPAPNPEFPMPISTVTGAQNIEVSGKNLFDMDDFLTAAEATYTKNGGQYSITAWGNLISIRYPLQSVKIGNTYTISLDGVAQSTANTRLQVYKNGYVVGTIYGGTDRQEHSYTFTADGSQYELNATYSSPFSSPVIFKNPQLELGSATAYEPYQGQSYEVNLGKNLYSETWENGGISASTGENNSDANIRTANYVSVLASTTYTASCDTGTRIALRFYNSAGTFLGAGTTSSANVNTFTTPANTARVRFVVIGASGVTPNFQLELGSTATTYAPYFTPIELAKVGNYQDRIYEDEGKWYVEKQIKKYVFDGSENWTLYPSKLHTFRTGLGEDRALDGICDHFVKGLASAFDVTPCFYASNTGVAIFSYPDMADVSAWTTWLGTHNTTVYYVLATPTTTEITDETLLAQLNFLASLYEGENNISLVGTGAQGEMAISYATDYTVNQDVITIDSQARTITLNGQDVYHLKTSESEFLVLAPGENKLYLTSEVSDDSGYAEVKFKQGYLSI